MAAKARAICSSHTKEQRAYYIARGMSMLYGHAQSADAARPDVAGSNAFLTTHDHALAEPIGR